MFLKDISTVVCTTLAEHKNLTIQNLFDKVKKHNIKISLPNFYKIIAKMIDEQIVVKKDNTLQLHWMWVHHTVMLADKIKLHYLQDDVINIEKLKPWQTQTFEAPSLYELDLIWTDMLWELYAKYTGQEAYYYNSHAYHILWMPEKEKWNLEELWKKMAKTYFLFWNKSFLDEYWAQLLAMQWYDIKCIEKTPFPEEWYCINIFGDYIVEVMFPETISQYFKMFFDTVKSAEEFNTELFANIIKMKAPCSLKLIHSPEHAEKMIKKIKQFFK